MTPSASTGGGSDDDVVTSPHVDYEHAARDYARHRTPTPDRLAIWGEVVRPLLRTGRTALDLGAGTGAFSAALVEWGARRVIAVEPSAGMQSEAADTDEVHRMRGRAEALPLTTDSIGFVWISTAFHHFADRARVVRECRRVLVGRGHVVVRGFVPGHTELAWLRRFPGWDTAVARFPDIETTNDLFGEAGFTLEHAAVVEEGTQTYAERADFSDRMRHADSILTAMSNAQVDAGIAALRSTPDEIEHFALSCLVYRGD